MKKKLTITAVFVASVITAGTALAIVTMDNNPTNERVDRRNSTDAVIKTAQLTAELLEETKKTNQLLGDLIRATNNKR